MAEKSLVKRFFPSEFGTDIEYGPESIHEIPYQQKLKVTDALRKTSRLEYACIVTGPYADGVEPAFFGPCAAALEIGSYEVKTKTAILIGDGTGKISFTSPQEYVFEAQQLKKKNANLLQRWNACCSSTAPSSAIEKQSVEGQLIYDNPQTDSARFRETMRRREVDCEIHQ